MNVHDWTRVDAGTYHAFHIGWLTHLSEALNAGRLPPGYYSLPEQHAGSAGAGSGAQLPSWSLPSLRDWPSGCSS